MHRKRCKRFCVLGKQPSCNLKSSRSIIDVETKAPKQELAWKAELPRATNGMGTALSALVFVFVRVMDAVKRRAGQRRFAHCQTGTVLEKNQVWMI